MWYSQGLVRSQRSGWKVCIPQNGHSQPQPPLGPQHQAYSLTTIKKWGGLGAGHALGPEPEVSDGFLGCSCGSWYYGSLGSDRSSFYRMAQGLASELLPYLLWLWCRSRINGTTTSA